MAKNIKNVQLDQVIKFVTSKPGRLFSLEDLETEFYGPKGTIERDTYDKEVERQLLKAKQKNG